MSGKLEYGFQPEGLNLKTHQPLPIYWTDPKRLEGAEERDVDLPTHVLGTQVQDKATGFNGMAIIMYVHINGCIHIAVKPEGSIEETGEAIAAAEFDIRRLEGPALEEQTEEQIQADIKQKPSPMGMPAFKAR